MMFVISMFTKALSAEQISAITFTPEYRKQIRDSWSVSDVIASLGVVALCGAFYWYFF